MCQSSKTKFNRLNWLQSPQKKVRAASEGYGVHVEKQIYSSVFIVARVGNTSVDTTWTMDVIDIT